MKLATTISTLVLSCSVLAQGTVEFPWNPDWDGDDIIGVNDMMAFLSVFGSEFSEENLYLSEDSLSAAYHVGQMNYFDCTKSCKNLPGNWKMWSLDDLDTSVPVTYAWINTPVEKWIWLSNEYSPMWKYGNEIHYLNPFSSGTSAQCVCVTRERPKVEYSYCIGSDSPASTELQTCADAKVEEGWRPLGPISPAVSVGRLYQAFWRWAD